MHWSLTLWLVTAFVGPVSPSEPPSPAEQSVVTPPVLIKFVQAQPVQVQGEAVEVRLTLDIDEGGRVTQVQVARSGGAAFDGLAADACRQFVFQPATDGGVPISVRIDYLYVFEPTPIVEPETVEPDDDRSVPDVDDSAVVRGVRLESEAAQTVLSRERGEQVAGAQGDVIKGVASLGGVATPSIANGEPIVWGADPAQTRAYVDWVPVPRLFHLGGTRSVVPSPMVESLTLVPGGFGVARGRAIGGMIRVETAAPRSAAARRQVGGFARIDGVDAGAGFDARFGRGGAVSAAVRRSLLRQTYGRIVPAESRKLVPLPDYWDYQAKAVVPVTQADTLTFLALGAVDEVERGIPSVTPDQRFTEERVTGFHRLGVQLLRADEDGSRLAVSTWGGFEHERVEQSFAAVQALDGVRTWAGGLWVEQRRRVARFLVITAGLDVEVRRSSRQRRGALTLPAREGDVVAFGQPPGERVGSDRWRNVQAELGAYVSAAFEFDRGRWTVEPGVRLEPTVTSGDRVVPVRPIEPEVGRTDIEFPVDPRLAVRWNPRAEVDVFAAGGRYHQAPSTADLSPVFGNPRLRVSNAYHAVAGLTARPVEWFEAALTGFWIRAQRLAARSADPTPELASVVVDTGDGRNFGGQIAVSVRPIPGVFGAAAYSIIRAQRRDRARDPWRLFDGDQTHIAQVLGGWSHRSGVELSGRVSVSSGNPRTDVVNAVYDAGAGGYDPVFGPHNGIRLPTFFELSLRVGWGRTWSWGTIAAWLDVQNVTNQRNVSEYFYNADFSSRESVQGFPILPSVGLEVRI